MKETEKERRGARRQTRREECQAGSHRSGLRLIQLGKD